MNKIVEVFLASVLVVVAVLVSGLLWDYAISNSLMLMHRPDKFELWHGIVLSFVPGIGQLSLPAAAIVFIAMMFL